MAAILSALVLGAAAGCARDTASAPRPEPGPPVWVEPECPRAVPDPMPAPRRGGIPDGFVTAWVLRCREELRQVPGDGTWTVLVTERADTPAGDLVNLLRRPSDPPSEGTCPALAVFPPYFLLVDADGRALLPAVPTDGCGIPRDEVAEHLDALPYRALSETRLARTRSERSAETGCSDGWKDTIAIQDGGAAAPARPLWPEPVESVGVCVYGRVAGGELPVGRLETGFVHTGASAAAVVDALGAAGPAAACDAPHSRFAVLKAENQAAWATVELDGCRRVQRPDGTLGQLDERTTELVTSR